jgi:fucose permease
MKTGERYNERTVFAVACTGMLLFGMAMLSLGTVNTYLTDRFSLDQLGVGSLAALLPFGIMAGSLIFGPVVDRFGYRLPLTVAAFLILVGDLLVTQSSTFPPVQFAFFLIGFGGGVLNGGTNALVADISGDKRGARLSLLGVFFGLGALGMPAVTALLLHVVSYKVIITGFGLAILLPVTFFLLTSFPTPKQSQGFPIKQGLALTRDRTLLLLSMVLFFESGAEGLVNNWSPAFLQSAGGMAVESSLLMLTILAASLAVTRLVLGAVLRKVQSRVVLVSCLATAIAGAGLLLLANGLVVSAAAMALMGVGFAAAFPVMFAYIGELFPSLSGTAFGIALVIALAGNTLLNYVLGLVSQFRGIGVFPWYMIFVLIFLGIFLWFGLRSFAIRISTPRS